MFLLVSARFTALRVDTLKERLQLMRNITREKPVNVVWQFPRRFLNIFLQAYQRDPHKSKQQSCTVSEWLVSSQPIFSLTLLSQVEMFCFLVFLLSIPKKIMTHVFSFPDFIHFLLHPRNPPKHFFISFLTRFPSIPPDAA